MKHGSAATTTIFPPDRNQTKTSRRLASRSGTVDPRLDEPRDDSRVPSASAGTKQQSSVGVCQIRCPHSGPTSVWVMATDELVAHAA